MKKLLPLFSIILLTINLLSCKSDSKEIKNETIDKTAPQQQLSGVFTVETNKRDTVRTIKAAFMKNYPNKKITIADSVILTEFEKDKKTILYCDRAEIDEIKDIYKCKGNVKVITENGILKTPFLIWDKKNDKITALNGVTLTREKNILKGETLITDSQLKKIKITKVSAKGKLQKKDIRW